MLKVAAVGGLLAWCFFDELKSGLLDLWYWEPGAEFEDGVLKMIYKKSKGNDANITKKH